MAINPSNLINVGTSPNDGQGDDLRNSFIKTNNLAIDLDSRVIDNQSTSSQNANSISQEVSERAAADTVLQNNIDAKVSDINHVAIELPNADNTSDVNKPISTATQSILDLKVNKTENEINTENIFKSVSFAMDFSDRVVGDNGNIESRECVMNEYLKIIK